MERSKVERVQAIERFAVIRPHVEEGVSQTEIVRMSGVPLKTVQRWIRAYRENGLAGLARKARADYGKSRGMPEELVMPVEGLALQPLRRPLTSIHTLVCEVAQEQSWPVPSYGQVYRMVQRLPADRRDKGIFRRGRLYLFDSERRDTHGGNI